MPGPRFVRLAVHLAAYGGAVAAAIAPYVPPAEVAPQSPLVAVPTHSPSGYGPDTVIGTQAAIQLSEHSDLFEFGG